MKSAGLEISMTLMTDGNGGETLIYGKLHLYDRQVKVNIKVDLDALFAKESVSAHTL